MSNDFKIETATRQGVIPLIGIFGKSGYGKTFSALLLARGLAGQNGRIVLVNTEIGRGGIFADEIPGGYKLVNVAGPYTPDKYESAIDFALPFSDVLVIDSASHSWESEGGVLETAEDIQNRSGKGMHNWTHKSAHSRMLRKICRLDIPVIVCMRSKDVTRQVKDDRGKTVFTTDKNTHPVQDKNFIFEMLIAFEMVKNQNDDPGYVRIEKFTSGQLLQVLPKPSERITVEHGEQIIKWCSAPVAHMPVQKPSGDPLTEAKQALWDATKPLRATIKKANDLQNWAFINDLIKADEQINTFTVEQLETLTAKIKDKLK